ncbi:MAG: nucleoside kinase, partial [Lachnospiraceae bacterium]|nr:nucleoside kinase [Lachnospiraceae bacterium]
MATVTINGNTYEYPLGISYEEIAASFQSDYSSPIALAVVNGRIRELFKRLTGDCEISFCTIRSGEGYRAYLRTVTMLFLKTVEDLFGSDAAQNCRVEFVVGNGHYISPVTQEGDMFEANEGTATQIEEKMRATVAKKLPILKKSYSIEEAENMFAAAGKHDKQELFRYRRSAYVNLYELDGYVDYYYGHMLPHTGYVEAFRVQAYEKGFLLLLPSKGNCEKVEPFLEYKKLFATLKETEVWCRRINIETVGDLNGQICKGAGSLSDLILVHEAEQERKIGEIAKDIVLRGDVKFVMISGPSSSGKTSFSHRLSIQLRTLGFVPHPIALDDYYVNRDRTPKDEQGQNDYECLEAIDTAQFNEDMKRLLAGDSVALPTFNFKTGQREYSGKITTLQSGDILVIEGIHGLNPKTSFSLPDKSKYKIYVSALTGINIDYHNRIPTTDARLLRRMVRDARMRGTTAAETIRMWSSVRRGEEKYIFPFQEEADAMFNSALIYELAVLKQYAEPLLFEIPKESAQYHEAT